MSAQEIIERIKELPAEERNQVVRFAQSLGEEATAKRTATPDWDAVVTKVFDEHEELFRKLAQ